MFLGLFVAGESWLLFLFGYLVELLCRNLTQRTTLWGSLAFVGISTY